MLNNVAYIIIIKYELLKALLILTYYKYIFFIKIERENLIFIYAINNCNSRFFISLIIT